MSSSKLALSNCVVDKQNNGTVAIVFCLCSCYLSKQIFITRNNQRARRPLESSRSSNYFRDRYSVLTAKRLLSVQRQGRKTSQTTSIHSPCVVREFISASFSVLLQHPTGQNVHISSSCCRSYPRCLLQTSASMPNCPSCLRSARIGGFINLFFQVFYRPLFFVIQF